MATFTTQLRSIIENGDTVFGPYPIFDESYRKTLEDNILGYYWTREIGLETVGLFKHFLRMRMALKMPYYNKLYLSERIVYDPMQTFNLKETFSKTASGTTTLNETTTAKELFNDTPQGASTITDHLTNVTENNDIIARTAGGNDLEEYTRETVGNTGTTSDSRLIKEFRDSFIQIDQMIIDELADLFFNLYEA